MKFRVLIGIFISCVLLKTASVHATPLRLTVQPKGTNQIELTFGPVVPGVSYEVLARTNGPEGHWITFAGAFFGSSNKFITATSGLGGGGDLQGLTMKTLHNWKFVAGCWDDTQGDEFPPLYKDLVLLADPFASADPYGNPMGDGWNNLQKLQNNMDPLRANLPPQPRSGIQFHLGTNSARLGKAVLTIENQSSALPDYFVIERAKRTPRPPSADPRYGRPIPGQANFRPPTNRPPDPRPAFNRTPFDQLEDPFVTGPYESVARITTKPGVQNYTYVESNVDTLFQPLYQVHAHFVPPFRASLTHVDAASIQQTILSVQMQPATNGFDLVALHPIPYGRYLLLVRDRNNPEWRASGYFTSGTNREPVHLGVDPKGMMTIGQSPIAMPDMKFQPDVVEPEFLAGWGEDSDGDGLPDIYEVLVTHTEPDNADTGNTGILDGYKELTGDGWSNLEKFRRRADPFKPTQPPAPVVLTQPTMSEAMQATLPKTYLPYEPQVEVRVIGTAHFEPIHQALGMLYQMTDPRNPYRVRGNFDLRISWVIPEPKPHVYGNGP